MTVCYIPRTSHRLAARVRAALGYPPRECFTFTERAGALSCPHYLAVPAADVARLGRIPGVRILARAPRGTLHWCYDPPAKTAGQGA